jgi:hypothetical protein
MTQWAQQRPFLSASKSAGGKRGLVNHSAMGRPIYGIHGQVSASESATPISCFFPHSLGFFSAQFKNAWPPARARTQFQGANLQARPVGAF